MRCPPRLSTNPCRATWCKAQSTAGPGPCSKASWVTLARSRLSRRCGNEQWQVRNHKGDEEVGEVETAARFDTGKAVRYSVATFGSQAVFTLFTTGMSFFLASY